MKKIYTKPEILSAIAKGKKVPISDLFFEDREVAFAASLSGNFFRIMDGIPTKFRNDKEYVLEVVEKWGIFDIEKMVGENLKDDQDVIETCLKQDLRHIAYFDTQRDNKDLVLRMISMNEWFRSSRGYDFLSERLKNDMDIVLAFLNKSMGIYDRLPDHLKSDPVVISAIASTDPKKYHIFLNEIPNEAKNRDFILRSVTNNIDNLEYVPKEYEDDREIVLRAIDTTVLSNKVLSRKSIVEWFVEDTPFGKMINDEQIALSLCTLTPHAVADLPDKFIKSKKFLKRAVKMGCLHYQNVFHSYLVNEDLSK